MMIEELLIGLASASVGVLSYVIKAQADAQKRTAVSIERLATSIAYCPMNRRNFEAIKKQDELRSSP